MGYAPERRVSPFMNAGESCSSLLCPARCYVLTIYRVFISRFPYGPYRHSNQVRGLSESVLESFSKIGELVVPPGSGHGPVPLAAS